MQSAGREAAINLGMRIVENLASRLLWRGQKSYIDREDLISVGMAEMIRTVDRKSPASGFPLDKRIVRNVKTVMLRYVQSEQREFRYRQRGSEKAIRDTEAGNQAGDVDGGADLDVLGAAPARIALSSRNRDFPNSDEFAYPSWLRGATSAVRGDLGYEFIELNAEDAPVLWRPVVQCAQWPASAITDRLRRVEQRLGVKGLTTQERGRLQIRADQIRARLLQIYRPRCGRLSLETVRAVAVLVSRHREPTPDMKWYPDRASTDIAA